MSEMATKWILAIHHTKLPFYCSQTFSPISRQISGKRGSPFPRTAAFRFFAKGRQDPLIPEKAGSLFLSLSLGRKDERDLRLFWRESIHYPWRQSHHCDLPAIDFPPPSISILAFFFLSLFPHAERERERERE
jgi:hypothetical protein